MANKRSRYKQGQYLVKNIKKYHGDPTTVVYRSSWEKHLFKYLDDNTNIVEWSSESIIIPYINPMDGKRHRYYPDIWAKIQDKKGNVKTVIMEVKPKKQTMEPEKKSKVTRQYLNEVVTYAINQAKFEAAEKYCEQKGWEFVLVTETDLGLEK